VALTSSFGTPLKLRVKWITRYLRTNSDHEPLGFVMKCGCGTPCGGTVSCTPSRPKSASASGYELPSRLPQRSLLCFSPCRHVRVEDPDAGIGNAQRDRLKPRHRTQSQCPSASCVEDGHRMTFPRSDASLRRPFSGLRHHAGQHLDKICATRDADEYR
jgi:hypothetical protein